MVAPWASERYFGPELSR